MSTVAACSLPEPVATIGQAGYSLDELPAHIVEAARQLQQGLTSRAIAALGTAPDAASASVALGWTVAVTVYCRQDNFATAIEVAQRGLQQVGQNTSLFDCLGVAFSGLSF